MVLAQLCVHTVSGFNGTLTGQTNTCRSLLSNSLRSLSGQLCFTTKRCRSIKCKSSGRSFYGRSSNHADDAPDILGISNPETKGSTISNSKVSDRQSVLVERDQLKDEVARKIKEIEKLRATIQFVIQHLTKAEVDSTSMEKQQVPSTPNPITNRQRRSHGLKNILNNEKPERNKGQKRPREENGEENNYPEKKKFKPSNLDATINAYVDDK